MEVTSAKRAMVSPVHSRRGLTSNGSVGHFNEKEMLTMTVIRKIIKEGKKQNPLPFSS